MRRKLRIVLFLALVAGQLLIYLYYPSLRISVDFLFLIIFYVAIRMKLLSALITAQLIGLLTDYFSVKVMGVFAFSRVLACFFLTEVSHFLDLRKSFFIFILIWLSLFFSNVVAALFLYLVHRFQFSHQLLLIQPLITSAVGTLILALPGVKDNLHVY